MESVNSFDQVSTEAHLYECLRSVMMGLFSINVGLALLGDPTQDGGTRSALSMQEHGCMISHVDCGRSLGAYTTACLSSRRADSSLKAQQLAPFLARTTHMPLTGAGTKSAGEAESIQHHHSTAHSEAGNKALAGSAGGSCLV